MNITCKFEWGISPYNINTLSSNNMDIVVPLGAMIPSLSGGGSVNGVESVNGKTGKHITLEASDLDTYTITEIDARIPTKLSDLGNDVDFITEDFVDIKLESKQDVLPTSGDGTKYLSDDGSYKAIQPTVDAYTKAETDTLLDSKADKSSISAVGYSNDYNDLDNLPNIPVVPTNISAFNNDVGYLTQHQDISGKVDKEVGKGLSTNDYSNADKTKVSKIITDGVGDKYLGDDGVYKTVSGGSGEVTSVNTKTGAVVLNASDVGAVSAAGVVTEVNKFLKVGGTSGVAPITHGSSSAVALGYSANANGNNSIAIGANSSAGNSSSIAIGTSASVLGSYSGGIAIGDSSMANINGVSIGRGAKATEASLAIGVNAKAEGVTSTAVGVAATTQTYTNSTALGYQATVTSSNQVQLGNSTTTTYAYGAVQDRSDARDKTDIRDIELGLDFINKLRPVEYKWDYREDYFADVAPKRDDFDSDEEYSTAYEQARTAFYENPVKDGSKTRARHHTGLIAQEVKQAMDDLGVDFGGFQHHRERGGLDVMSLGYNELIAVLIKAVQEVNLKCEQLQRELDVFRNNI